MGLAVSDSSLPWCARSGDHAHFFQPQAGAGATCLQMGRVDHQRISANTLIRKPEKHLCEVAFLAPALQTAVSGLVRPVFCRRIALPQAVAVDEDNAAQHPLVVRRELVMGLREKGCEPDHLRGAQPVSIAHVTAPFFGAVNHAAQRKTVHSAP